MTDSIADRISLAARMDPDRPAIVCNGYTTTYEALDRSIRSTEAWLMNEGLRSWRVVDEPVRKLGSPSNSDVVMVSAVHPVEFLACLIASLDSGASVLPIPPRVSKQTRIEMIRKLHVGRVLRNSKQRFNSGKSLTRPSFHSGILIDITSGSYGAKKLVDRHVENLNDEAHAVADALNLHMGRKVLITTPLAHSFGGGIARAAMMAGATIYAPGDFDLPRKLVEIRKVIGEVDIVTGVPYIFRRLMLSWNERLLPDLRCYAGGEVVPPSLIRTWRFFTGSTLRQEYGLSEGGIVSFGDASSPDDSIGRPIRGVRIDILADELVVYRPWAPSRYHFGESSSTFLDNGGIRTGDLGWTDGDGLYYLTGRRKSVIIVAGMKVVPAEVERTLQEHPNIDEAVVFGRNDDTRGEVPIAIVTTKNGPLDTADVMRFVRERLESYKVPRRIYVTNEFPRTESGKIDRTAVKEF